MQVQYSEAMYMSVKIRKFMINELVAQRNTENAEINKSHKSQR